MERRRSPAGLPPLNEPPIDVRPLSAVDLGDQERWLHVFAAEAGCDRGQLLAALVAELRDSRDLAERVRQRLSG
jgi:hypothetical protein